MIKNNTGKLDDINPGALIAQYQLAFQHYHRQEENYFKTHIEQGLIATFQVAAEKYDLSKTTIDELITLTQKMSNRLDQPNISRALENLDYHSAQQAIVTGFFATVLEKIDLFQTQYNTNYQQNKEAYDRAGLINLAPALPKVA